MSGTIAPLTLESTIWFDFVVMAVGIVAVMAISIFGKKMQRWQGICFVALYVAYIAYIILRDLHVVA